MDREFAYFIINAARGLWAFHFQPNEQESIREMRIE